MAISLTKPQTTNKFCFPILFCFDSCYATHAGVALYSLFVTNANQLFKIYVIGTEIGKRDLAKIANICKQFHCEFHFLSCDVSILNHLPETYHFNRSIYYRLFAADLVPEEKCLYLDSDLIVMGDISSLIEINLSDFSLAAVKNKGCWDSKLLGLKSEDQYFNSGVMVLNLEKWRELALGAKAIEFIQNNHSKLRFGDQDGLNAVIAGNWLRLDESFNFQQKMVGERFFDESDPPVIVHFTGSSKPWHFNNRHPWRKHYWQYRNQTPFKKYISDDLSIVTVLRFFAPRFVIRSVRYLRKKLFPIF